MPNNTCHKTPLLIKMKIKDKPSSLLVLSRARLNRISLPTMSHPRREKMSPKKSEIAQASTSKVAFKFHQQSTLLNMREKSKPISKKELSKV